MTFHRQRHVVLAGNVANVDSPGYRPFDLERAGTTDATSSLPMKVTRAGHMSAEGSLHVTAFEDAGETQTADGNAVNLERELAKMDANRVRYTTATELVSRRLAILRYAAGDGQL